MSETPRAGETWERVRDHRRITVIRGGDVFVAWQYDRPLDVDELGGFTTPARRFLREFRRVGP